MKTDPSGDSPPDPRLGALLRESLAVAADGAFVARVLAALPEAGEHSPWELLAGWSRPSLVAASVAAALLTGWLGLRWGEALPGSDEPRQVVAEQILNPSRLMDGEGLMAVALYTPGRQEEQ